jgi:signal transduction histidine kinase
VCYPLQSGLDVYGAVILSSASNQMPSEQHLRLMRAFINQAAVAFQNAKLYQNLRRERDRIIEAEGTARAKLARDLHDGPTQSISALAMRLDFIRLLLDRDPAQAKQELEQAREAVMRVGKDLRGLLFTLRPLTLESQGLSAALKQYAERLRENDNVAIHIQPGSFGRELEPNIAGTIFAVIEEAINNARKHARGAPIHVQVQQQGNALLATVRDEGPGFDMETISANYSERGSLGLVNMQDRARLVEGTLKIESAPGHGTRVSLRVPLPDRRAQAHAQTPTERNLSN